MARTRNPPWDRTNPRKTSGKASKHLSPRQKATAKARARRAGRPYPNLVDNMRVAAKAKRPAKSSTKSKAARKSSTKRKTATLDRRDKDPRGGLTAAGRKTFAKSEGAHLRPGVTKKLSQMTANDMRRKGSWAVRFYGRKQLPALLDKQGRPTRFALSAHAWGERVPRTASAARKIAAKGRLLLERYQKIRRKARSRAP
jgi:Domain of unknown function (DUF6321)